MDSIVIVGTYVRAGPQRPCYGPAMCQPHPVAEGVETTEQSRLLRSLSCDEMQGYLFSKPVPREIFESRYLMAAATA